MDVIVTDKLGNLVNIIVVSSIEEAAHAYPDCNYAVRANIVNAGRVLTYNDLRHHFSMAERMRWDAAPDNQGLPEDARKQIKTWQTDLTLFMQEGKLIDLDDPEVIAGLHLCEQLGILDPGSADRVIAGG